MGRQIGQNRNFLFLQGPHGPFFDRLAGMLRLTGARVLRAGFNAGDRFFWSDGDSYLPVNGAADDWPGTLAAMLADHAITDIVLYGDTRPIHAEAVAQGRAAGLRVHVFEEGYLRPYWITYERGGSNGHSRLMEMDIAQMRAALEGADIHPPAAPAHWGDMRQHVFYGALYHFHVMFRNARYPRFRPHRDLHVRDEFGLYLKRLLRMPLHAAERFVATWRIRHGGFPYHLVLLQLEHDASFRHHGPFGDMAAFVATCVAGFAQGAAPHHHLVFKAHPLEDGRTDNHGEIRRLARAHGVAHRVHYVRGGKLARLLDQARGAITVNSTAGQQVLWRGLPLKVFGRAVYDKPDFDSTVPLAEFFSNPGRPDRAAYRDYRRYLLETSQVAGGFYSARGRRQLLRQVVDMMLADEDPYDALRSGKAAPRQQLHLVN